MSSILKVDQLQDSGGNSIISSNGSGTFTPGSLNIANAQIASDAAIATTKLGTGAIIQVVQATGSSTNTTTSTSYVDASFLSASITPSSTSNKILINCAFTGMNVTGNKHAEWTIYKNNTTNLGFGSQSSLAFYYTDMGGYLWNPITIMYLDSPSTTSSTQYDLYHRARSGGTTYTGTDETGGTITLMEIAG